MSDKPKSEGAAYYDAFLDAWRATYDPVTIERAMYGNSRDRRLDDATRGATSPLGGVAKPAVEFKRIK